MSYPFVTKDMSWSEVKRILGFEPIGLRGPAAPLKCAVCGVENIPCGLNCMDWAWLVGDKPVHQSCIPAAEQRA